jgi:hypothetical protein
MNNPWKDINQTPKDVNARRIDHTHPLDLYWARDFMGRFLFIYEFEPMVELPINYSPDLVGIKVVFLQANAQDSKNRLVLLLKEQDNWELFYSLCNDLVQTTRSSENPHNAINIILHRLARWQDFLKRDWNGILSEEKIKGLIGELIFLQRYLIPTFGANQSIKFWLGPDGSPQDFNVNDSAIEVKCQSGASTPSVKISSADQLCPQLPKIYLFVVTLGKATPENQSVINLPGLVSNIRETLVSEGLGQIERFNDLLLTVGYSDSELYQEFNYILISKSMYFVREGFPRICPNDIHEGILNLSYSIRLSECEPFTGKPDWLSVEL